MALEIDESKKLDIPKLLRKRKWKGADVGRIVLADASISYNNALQAGASVITELQVSAEQIDKMLATITDPTERDIYSGYLSISRWLSSTNPLAQAQQLQATMHFNKISDIVYNAYKAEDVYQYIEELPLIMTEKQYKETVDKRTHEILNPDGGPIANNVFQLILNALDHYINLYAEHPDAENPLTPLKEKMEHETVKDAHILDKYNAIKGFGYYTTKDGIRSDEVSESEWRKIVNPVIGALFDENNGMSLEEKASKAQAIVTKRMLETARIMYEEDLPEIEASEKMQAQEDLENHVKPLTWHYYPEPPEDLNKWEILTDGDFPEYYPYFDATEEEAVKMYEAFNAEFPEVVQALLKDMEERYKDKNPVGIVSGTPPIHGWGELSKLPVKKWGALAYSWEELCRINFYNFRQTYTGDTAIFEENRRAIFNGIAILRPSDLLYKSPRIDENGYYKAPENKLWKAITPFSLETFFEDYEDFQYHINEIANSRNTFYASLYFVEGYNKTLELIASMYKVEEVKLFRLDNAQIYRQIDALNNSIYLLYKRIKETDYEDKELQKRKLEVIREYFKPLDIAKIEIPKGKLASAKAHMKNFAGFRNGSLDPYIDLCIYDPHAVKDRPVKWDYPKKTGGQDGN